MTVWYIDGVGQPHISLINAERLHVYRKLQSESEQLVGRVSCYVTSV